MAWITNWTEIGDKTKYLVCPINRTNDGPLCLGQPVGVMPGWEVKRYMERCYAAIELPEWDGKLDR